MIGAVYLDWGHVGQPRRPNVTGATSDELIEVFEVARYMAAIVRRCYELDVFVQVDANGAYSERQRRAVDFAARFAGPVVYAACHLNMFVPPVPQRVGFFYDARSSRGADIADHLVSAFHGVEYANTIRAIKAKPDDWTKNALYCIRGIYDGGANIGGITLEPLGLNGRPVPTPDVLADVGRRIADGFAAHLTS